CAYLGHPLDRPEPGGAGEARGGPGQGRPPVPGVQWSVAGLPRCAAGARLGTGQAGQPEPGSSGGAGRGRGCQRAPGRGLRSGNRRFGVDALESFAPADAAAQGDSMIVRPVRSSDLPALIELARSTGTTGLTTLPANEERL